jgi:hypothetical protein
LSLIPGPIASVAGTVVRGATDDPDGGLSTASAGGLSDPFGPKSGVTRSSVRQVLSPPKALSHAS